MPGSFTRTRRAFDEVHAVRREAASSTSSIPSIPEQRRLGV